MTTIEWTQRPGTKGETWNPIRARLFEPTDDGAGRERVGWHCEHVSEGCRNCYAEAMNRWRGTGFDYKPGNLRGKRGYHGGGIDRPQLFLDEAALLKPLRWRAPRTIFVCSMTDLFADFVADEWIDRLFAVMALYPQHTFQILSKRPERMRAYMLDTSQARSDGRGEAVWALGREHHPDPDALCLELIRWPLPNVWLGTSVEDQATADQRIPHLLATPAALRFVSAEPLLGPVRLHETLGDDWLASGRSGERRGLAWITTGGESGPAARPMHPDWVRSLRDQCAAAGVPFFFKQWGEWIGGGPGRFHVEQCREIKEWHDGCFSCRVGRQTAGSLLDGVEHRAFPEPR